MNTPDLQTAKTPGFIEVLTLSADHLIKSISSAWLRLTSSPMVMEYFFFIGLTICSHVMSKVEAAIPANLSSLNFDVGVCCYELENSLPFKRSSVASRHC